MASARLPVFVWLPISSAALAGLVLAIVYRVEIQDWMYFRSYTPSAEVIELGQRVQFTEEGERLFQRADPEVVEKVILGTRCPGQHNLGCLIEGPKILIRETENNSDTARLEQNVTVAHEMLHMAYTRFSDEERLAIDVLVATELIKDENTSLLNSLQRFSDTVEKADEAYAQLGTQAQEVGPELEAHYAQYLQDRAAIVADYEASN